MQVQENDIDLNNTEAQNLIKKYISKDSQDLKKLENQINSSLDKFLKSDKENDKNIQVIKSEIINDINDHKIFENIKPIEIVNGIESNAEFEEFNESTQTSETEEFNQEEANTSDASEELNQLESNSSDPSEELNQLESNSFDASEELNQVESNSFDASEELNQVESNASDPSKELNQQEANTSDVSEELRQEAKVIFDAPEEINKEEMNYPEVYEELSKEESNISEITSEQNEIDNCEIVSLKIGQKINPNTFISPFTKFYIFDKNDIELNCSNANIKLSFCNKNKKYCINFDNRINVYILLNKSKTIQRFTMVKKSSMFLNHFGFNNEFNDIHRIDIC